ncbi:hypothetical protein B9T31_02930 [Acinetobacter sp. ANC 4558]|uniref:serine hydrolase n=1 Tax=Acinetobacter sp. ANC 4558 TaxID=1977876 RepID=UPI000A34DE34|nr:serine hydrolase [Acinetobacter sp. ANC 4558]OTG87474.1 hypothetical protein B9T31_02930 [Acinetobacter sp. ANC 4558]
MSIKKLTVLSAFLLTITASGCSIFKSSMITEEKNAKKIIVDRIDQQHKAVGIALALSNPQGNIFINHGVQSHQNSKPITSDTIFEIGSISKIFTNVLLAQHIIDKKISLDAPAQNYMPADIVLPKKNGKEITLFDLATHHSGLPSVPPKIFKAPIENPYADLTRQDLAEFLQHYELSRLPGEAFEYSNIGTTLIGLALENVAGKPYEELVQSIILNPLGMSETWANVPKNKNDRYAEGYNSQGTATSHWDLGVFLPAGGWHSTARDMSRFLNAASQIKETPLSPAFSLMLSHTRPIDTESDLKIGLGWIISNQNIVWHNGMTGGFSAITGYRLDNKHGVLILSNQASASSVDDIAMHLLDSTNPLQAPPAKIPFHSVPTTLLTEYQGRYRMAADIYLDVLVENDRLFVEVNGQGKAEFQAVSDYQFTAPALMITIEFQRNSTGQIQHLIVDQQGMITEAPRMTQHVQ